MTLLISEALFKKQAKLLVRYWPRPPLKHTQALEYLAQLYGFKHHFHYHSTLLNQIPIALNAEQIQSWFTTWVQQFAHITHLNQIQTKTLILLIWGHILKHYPALATYMYRCDIHFKGACLDFVSNPTVHLAFDDKPSVKTVVESLGVPHVEVAALLVNQVPVNFDYQLQDKDVIEVLGYPHAKPLVPLFVGEKPRFVLDVHLGVLARYLRLCGFDCWYSAIDQGDEALAQISADEQRIFLSRDLGALKRSKVQFGHWVRASDSVEQWREIIIKYQLKPLIQLGLRCVKCNSFVHKIAKEQLENQVPEQVYKLQTHFTQCPSCRQIYWRGSHYDRVLNVLNTMQGV